MRNDRNWRFFRILVCLVLICCIIFNCSPIRAEASLTVAITGAGIMSVLFAMAMGVVAVDLTADLINGMGQSFEEHLYGSVTGEETEILEIWIEPLKVDLDSGSISQLPPDGDDDNNFWAALGGVFTIPEELLDDCLGWAKKLINDNGIEIESNTAPDGYAYYNGVLLPVPVGHTKWYTVIYRSGDTYKAAYINYGDGSFVAETVGSYWFVKSKKSYNVTTYTDGAWGNTESKTVLNSVCQLDAVVWSNYDITYSDGTVAFEGTAPSSVKTEPVTPIYVGDIPSQVRENTFDDEEYELPYINYQEIFKGKTDVIDALNDTATKLQNQTITYDQYMEQIKTEIDTGTGNDTNTGTNSGTNSGSDTWQPPENPGAFALDLTDVFPFCIPFDLYDFLSCLNADPVTPVIEWAVPLPGGSSYPLELDLSPFDSVAQLLRRLQLLLFILGLAIKTRDLIKG